jgi:hypothetical protein
MIDVNKENAELLNQLTITRASGRMVIGSHSVTLSKLENAISEARRFIVAALEAKARMKSDIYTNISGSKQTGAAKRASLDLTRALAEMRKT